MDLGLSLNSWWVDAPIGLLIVWKILDALLLRYSLIKETIVLVRKELHITRKAQLNPCIYIFTSKALRTKRCFRIPEREKRKEKGSGRGYLIDMAKIEFGDKVGTFKEKAARLF